MVSFSRFMTDDGVSEGFCDINIRLDKAYSEYDL